MRRSAPLSLRRPAARRLRPALSTISPLTTGSALKVRVTAAPPRLSPAQPTSPLPVSPRRMPTSVAELREATDSVLSDQSAGVRSRMLAEYRRLADSMNAPWCLRAKIAANVAHAMELVGDRRAAARHWSNAIEIVSVHANDTSVALRTFAATNLVACCSAAAAREEFLAAAAIVESGTAAAMQRQVGPGDDFAPLDPVAPFLAFVTSQGVSELAAGQIGLLRRGLAAAEKYCITTSSSASEAHALLATNAGWRDPKAAGVHWRAAAAHLPTDTTDPSGILRRAAQHLHFVERDISAALPLYEAALRAARRCLDQTPPGARPEGKALLGELLFNTGLCYEQHSRFGCSYAASVFREALAQFPPDSPATTRLRLYYARSLSGSGHVDKAVEQYAKCAQRAESDTCATQLDANGRRGLLHPAEVHGHVALCLCQRADDLQGARRHYARAFSLAEAWPHPLPARTLEWLWEGQGHLWLRSGQAQPAVEAFTQKILLADERGDKAVDAHLQIAAAHESLKQYDDARAVYEFLFGLPEELTTRDQRLELLLRYAWLCHYSIRDYERAAALYVAAMQLDPDNPHTMVQAAWCMLQAPTPNIAEIRQFYDGAVRVVETAAKEGQTAATWDRCYVYGECAVFCHDYTKDTARAEELYDAAVNATQPSENFAQVAANFGVLLHYERRNTERAQHWFERAVAAGGENPQPSVVMLYAEFLQSTNQLEEAKKQLKSVVHQLSSEAHHKLARIAERQSDLGAALSHYAQALGGAAPNSEPPTPDSSEAQSTVAGLVERCEAMQLPIITDLMMMLQTRLRAFPLVARLYRHLLAAFPVDGRHLLPHFAKFASEGVKDKGAALRAYRRALALDPANVSLLDSFADFLATNLPDRLDLAERCHLESVRRNPRTPQAHFCYASFLTHVAPAPQLAEQHFRLALSLDPKDPVTLCCYATFLDTQAEQHGREWECYREAVYHAEQMFREAIRLGPHTASHYTFFGSFLWRLKRLPEAWDAYESALALDSNSSMTLRLAATFLHDWIATQRNRGSGGADGDSSRSGPTTQLARQLFEKAVQLEPSDAVLLRSFARFVDEIEGDGAGARQLYVAAGHVQAEEDTARAAVTEERAAASKALGTELQSGETSAVGELSAATQRAIGLLPEESATSKKSKKSKKEE